MISGSAAFPHPLKSRLIVEIAIEDADVDGRMPLGELVRDRLASGKATVKDSRGETYCVACGTVRMRSHG